MTTTLVPHTTEPPDLSGFVTHYGVRVGILGDDGDTLVALGHHDTKRVVAAFNRMVRQDLGWIDLREINHIDDYADAAEQVERRWANLLTECGECGNDPACRECQAIKDGDWWMNYGSTEPQPGAFPVTILGT